jgi:hypothetical protein
MHQILPKFDLHRTRYSNLLQTLEHVNLEYFGKFIREGTIVHKNIKGLKYWYFQKMEDGELKSFYIGRDTPELQTAINNLKHVKPLVRQLTTDLINAGGTKFGHAQSVILSSLHDSGLFAAGVVLIGTNAFLAYQNLLGIKWSEPTEVLATNHIDFAQFSKFSIGIPINVAEDIRNSLNELSAQPLFPMHQKGESCIFQTAIGTPGLNVEFLTPLIGQGPASKKTHSLPWVGISAQPIRFLDYLIENRIRAAILLERGSIFANLPDPARYALHKIIVAEKREGAWLPKKKKDRVQAGALIDYFVKNDISLLEQAWEDLHKKHPSWGKIVQKGIWNLPPYVTDLPWVRENFRKNSPRTTH